MLNAKLQASPAFPVPSFKVPELEQSKASVLASLPSPNSRRSYEHAISKFIEWYVSAM
jgi:hypothetical protein